MFKKLDRAISILEIMIVVLGLSLSVIIAFTEVILRKFFGSTLGFSSEAVDFLLIMSGLIGSSIGVRNNAHIGIDIIVQQLPKQWNRFFVFVNFAVCIIFCLIIVILGIEHVNIMKRFGQVTPELGIPWYIPKMIVPVSFGLMALRFLQELIKNVRNPDTSLYEEGEVELR